MNRTRTTDLRQTLSGGGYLPTQYGTDKVGPYTKKIQSGADTPNIKELRKLHLPKPWNDYTMTHEASLETPYRRWNKFYGTWYWYSTVGTKTVSVQPPDWTSNEILEVLNSLNQKVEGGSWKPAVTAGELGESLRTIGNRAKSIAAAFNALRHGDLSSAARYLGGNTHLTRQRSKLRPADISDFVLEQRYGWAPMLGDIVDASTYIGERLSASNSNVVSAVRRKVGICDKDLSTDKIYPWSPSRYERILVARAYVPRGTPPAPNVLDPTSDLWELVPGSFLVDWFFPIGNWLEALDLQRSVASGEITVHLTKIYSEWHGSVFRGKNASKTSAAPSYMENSEVYRRYKYFSVVRDANYNFTVPSPSFTWLDPLDKDLRKTQNAVALAVSAGTRLFGRQ